MRGTGAQPQLKGVTLMNIHYDKNLDIAFGNSHKTKVWKNKTVR